ncbi:MAG: hypothetical protein KC736_02580 [Candidatus Moranbacteria bacterium]|nr:hypothetical protein [Candidatus Moranbacteria bacterium]
MALSSHGIPGTTSRGDSSSSVPGPPRRDAADTPRGCQQLLHGRWEQSRRRPASSTPTLPKGGHPGKTH